MIAGTQLVASVDVRFNSTIRHTKCDLLLEAESSRCHICTTYRKSLHAMVSRHEKTANIVSNTEPSSHVNYRFLTPAEKGVRLQKLHDQKKKTEQKLKRLSAKLALRIEEEGVHLDEGTHSDLLDMMVEHKSAVDTKYPNNSFQKLFWEQQQKASSLGR